MDVDRRLAIALAVVAVLAMACIVLGGLLARAHQRLRRYEHDQWFVCMRSLNLLDQLAARDDDDLELIETATDLGATSMCTGEVQPSTYECLMLATDKHACWAKYVAHWSRVFEEHKPEWPEPDLAGD